MCFVIFQSMNLIWASWKLLNEKQTYLFWKAFLISPRVPVSEKEQSETINRPSPVCFWLSSYLDLRTRPRPKVTNLKRYPRWINPLQLCWYRENSWHKYCSMAEHLKDNSEIIHNKMDSEETGELRWKVSELICMQHQDDFKTWSSFVSNCLPMK